MRLRRRNTCPVPGHGTRCIAVWERGQDDYYERCTEERMALAYELAAEGLTQPMRAITAE